VNSGIILDHDCDACSAIGNTVVMDNVTTGLALGVGGTDCIADGNHVKRGLFGIQVNHGTQHAYASARDVSAMVRGNRVYGAATGIKVSNTASAVPLTSVQVTGNHVTDASAYGVMVLSASSIAMSGVNVSGNSVRTTTSDGIMVNAASGAAISRVRIDSNDVSGVADAADCIRVSAAVAGEMTDVSAAGNICTDGRNGVYLENVDNVSVSGGVIKSSANNGVYYTAVDGGGATSRRVAIGGGIVIDSPAAHGIQVYADAHHIEDVDIGPAIIKSPTQSGVNITADSTLTISRVGVHDVVANTPGDTYSGIYIHGATADNVSAVTVSACKITAGQTGVLLSSVKDASVTNNDIASATDYGIEVLNCNDVRVLGNDVRGCANTALGIVVQGLSKQGCSVRGNKFDAASGNCVYFSIRGDLGFISVAGNDIISSVDASPAVRVVALSSVTPLDATITSLMIDNNNIDHVATNAVAIELNADDVAPGAASFSRFSVSGNMFTLHGGGKAVDFTGDGDMSGGVVTGNKVHGGTNPISDNNSGTFTDVYVAANFFWGYATAPVSAGFTYGSIAGDSVADGVGTDTLPNFKDA
jgi:hypothetical protein